MKEELTETANSFKKDVLDYVNIRMELHQWLLVEKGSKFFSKLLFFFLALTISGTVFFFISVALGFMLGESFDNLVLGFVMVAGIYLVLGLVIWAFKSRIIERPIISTMIELVFRNESKLFEDEKNQ